MITLLLAPLALAALLSGPPLSGALKVSFVTAIAAHVADIGTTTACIAAKTCKEINPTLRWAQDSPLTLSLTKGLLAGALQLIPYKLATSGHPRWALVVNILQSVAFTALAVRNERFN